MTTPQADCMLFAREINNMGYGVVYNGGKVYRAHRFVYEGLVGDIPAGLALDHLCKIPRCVNPDHLEPVTYAENMRRKFDGKCKQGHQLTPENCYWGVNNRNTGNNTRRCKICHKERSRLRYMKLRQEGKL